MLLQAELLALGLIRGILATHAEAGKVVLYLGFAIGRNEQWLKFCRKIISQSESLSPQLVWQPWSTKSTVDEKSRNDNHLLGLNGIN